MFGKPVRNNFIPLRWGIVMLLLFVSLLYSWQKYSSPAVISENKPVSEEVVYFTIEPTGPDEGSYSRTLDFGKGKFAAFWVHPPNEDLNIEEVRVRKEGADDNEIPFAWLRVNSVRVYVREPFIDNVVTFRSFPPKDISGLEYEVYKDIQEEQKLLVNLADLPYVAPISGQTSIQIYGQFSPDIASRQQWEGIRFCVEEISGTLSPSGRKASTQFASPLCFPKMGILP